MQRCNMQQAQSIRMNGRDGAREPPTGLKRNHARFRKRFTTVPKDMVRSNLRCGPPKLDSTQVHEPRMSMQDHRQPSAYAATLPLRILVVESDVLLRRHVLLPALRKHGFDTYDAGT